MQFNVPVILVETSQALSFSTQRSIGTVSLDGDGSYDLVSVEAEFSAAPRRNPVRPGASWLVAGTMAAFVEQRLRHGRRGDDRGSIPQHQHHLQQGQSLAWKLEAACRGARIS
jgi:hypothetical protein